MMELFGFELKAIYSFEEVSTAIDLGKIKYTPSIVRSDSLGDQCKINWETVTNGFPDCMVISLGPSPYIRLIQKLRGFDEASDALKSYIEHYINKKYP